MNQFQIEFVVYKTLSLLFRHIELLVKRVGGGGVRIMIPNSFFIRD